MTNAAQPGCPTSVATPPRLRWARTHEPSLNKVFLAVLSAALLVCTHSASAQGHGGGGGGGGMRGSGGMGGGFERTPLGGNNRTYPPPNGPGGPSVSTISGRLQLGPAGRWWDNKDFARTIGIDPGQQRRLDDVFSGNRNTLLKLYQDLQHEESQLAKTIRGKDLDEAQIFAAIDRVTQARGELEKANAHLLLQLRKELTPDQTAKLDDHRPPSE